MTGSSWSSGPPPPGSDRFEIVVHERDLRPRCFVIRATSCSFRCALSVITGGLVYWALRLHARPPDAAAVAATSPPSPPRLRTLADRDRAERPARRDRRRRGASCRHAEGGFATTLAQRRHLADLGLAVSKINHDLRNILASAQLFSDRIGAADDPVVKRFAPKLIGAIDRAIDYTPLRRSPTARRRRSRRAASWSRCRAWSTTSPTCSALPGHERVHWENRVPPGLEVDGDPEQLFRVLMNLCRNALEARRAAATIPRSSAASGWRASGRAASRLIRSAIPGPGVPERARANLFQPFQGSTRQGGTGPWPRHRGRDRPRPWRRYRPRRPRRRRRDVFEITIPDRPVRPRARRHARARLSGGCSRHRRRRLQSRASTD